MQAITQFVLPFSITVLGGRSKTVRRCTGILPYTRSIAETEGKVILRLSVSVFGGGTIEAHRLCQIPAHAPAKVVTSRQIKLCPRVPLIGR